MTAVSCLLRLPSGFLWSGTSSNARNFGILGIFAFLFEAVSLTITQYTRSPLKVSTKQQRNNNENCIREILVQWEEPINALLSSSIIISACSLVSKRPSLGMPVSLLFVFLSQYSAWNSPDLLRTGVLNISLYLAETVGGCDPKTPTYTCRKQGVCFRNNQNLTHKVRYTKHGRGRDLKRTFGQMTAFSPNF